ncbi:Uncharacterised protein [Streptococcus pneumoniae]|nr:Uncharacterised protein [Streptococcus pneumoniae]
MKDTISNKDLISMAIDHQQQMLLSIRRENYLYHEAIHFIIANV